MIGHYYKHITAIMWDGEQSTLEILQKLYSGEMLLWITSSQESKNALRINMLKQQGDYWVEIGNYIELCTYGVHIHAKEYFEKTFI